MKRIISKSEQIYYSLDVETLREKIGIKEKIKWVHFQVPDEVQIIVETPNLPDIVEEVKE